MQVGRRYASTAARSEQQQGRFFASARKRPAVASRPCGLMECYPPLPYMLYCTPISEDSDSESDDSFDDRQPTKNTWKETLLGFSNFAR